MTDKRKYQTAFIILFYFGTFQFPVQVFADTHQHLNAVISSAKDEIFQSRNHQGFWDQFNYTFGVARGGQTYLGNRLLGVSEYLDRKMIAKFIRSSQLEDGSWNFLPDNNLSSGDLNATVLNYLFLKSISIEDPVQVKAKNYILSHGGIEKTRFDVRFFLALMGSYPWQGFDSIDLNVAVFFFEKSQFARWIGPSFYPMFYLLINRVTKPLATLYPNQYNLDELFVGEKPAANRQREYSYHDLSLLSLKTSLHIVEDKILNRQKREGSWSGYINSTSLSILALEHYLRHIHELDDRTVVELKLQEEKVDQAIQKAYLFQTTWGWNRPSSSKGLFTDSRFWDTALLTNALLDAGMSEHKLRGVGNFLADNQGSGGGFPFGIDFWSTPDTDDTAFVLSALNKLGIRKLEQKQALEWMISMQNDDGGWAAFTKNLKPVLYESQLEAFAPIAFFYDFSASDITGHVLETLAGYGYTGSNSDEVKRAIQYLKESQIDIGDDHAAWEGTWGTNYLYGTGAALVGLLKVGEDVNEAYIQKSINWLLSRQNPDGGFGESTRSFTDQNWAGKGVSTPTQTAWVVLALLETGLLNQQVEEAVAYLVSQYKTQGRWIDQNAVGTVHHGFPNLDYPSYPYAFPLMALAKYRDRLNKFVATKQFNLISD